MTAPGGAARDPIWDVDLGSFVRSVGGADPTPGGGAVAGVAAALGGALVRMALVISSAKHVGEDLAEAERLVGRADEALVTVRSLPGRDAAAFDAYMAALALPKADDAEKTRRRSALAAARLTATEVPLETARTVLVLLGVASDAVRLSTPHVVSDVGAGAELLAAAGRSALLNVDVNTLSAKDPWVAAAVEERRSLARDINDVASAVADAVTRRMKG